MPNRISKGKSTVDCIFILNSIIAKTLNSGQKLYAVFIDYEKCVYFFKNGHWNRTQKHIADHASKALHRLFSILYQYEFKTVEKCKLFDILVASVLNYASEVWGMNDGKDIEIIHTKFLRKILCVNKSTNLVGLYGELGRVPLNVLRKVNMIRYWTKILQPKEDSLERYVYTMLKHDANNNIQYNGKNWAYNIKTILESLGLGNLWLQQENANLYLPLIRQRILINIIKPGIAILIIHSVYYLIVDTNILS